MCGFRRQVDWFEEQLADIGIVPAGAQAFVGDAELGVVVGEGCPWGSFRNPCNQARFERPN